GLMRSTLARPAAVVALVFAALGCTQQDAPVQREPTDDAEIDFGPLPDAAPRPDAAPPAPPPDPCAPGQIFDFNTEATTDADGQMIFSGQMGDDAAFGGSCGGSGPTETDRVIKFTAPEAGAWQFFVTPRERFNERFDPILYARTTCDDPDTELGCNDDVAPGRLESQLRLDLGQGEVVYLIVDTIRPLNANRFLVSARRIPIVGVGEACDVAEAQNGCPEESYCRTDPAVRGPEGVCAPRDAPVIDEVFATRFEGVLGLRIQGHDEGGDVDKAHIQLLAGDEVIQLNDQGADTYILTPLEPTFGQQQINFLFRSALLGDFPQTTAISVRLVDTLANRSEPVRADLGSVVRPGAGQACDPNSISSVCADDQTCIDASCRVATAPRLTRAKGYYLAETLRTGFEVEGIDPDQDARGLRLELLGPDDDRVLISGDLNFNFVRTDADAFSALLSATLPRDVGATRARLTPFDAVGLFGEPMIVEGLTPPRRADDGDTCDPAGAVALCREDGSTCFVAQGEALPHCGAPVVQCPESYGELVDLNAYAERDEWRYEGDLTTRYNITRGTCGGGSAQTVFQFTAEDPGVYSFITFSPAGGADTVLYARSHCGYGPDRARVELGCSDDISADNAFSLLRLPLDEGESIYLFVDGASTASGAWRGPFSLTARRLPD
ncbi:MAG: hypothetical protein KC620_22920, partial [Myxococcales bacterium]|nr:hypothetical protein [Myxococcales bacterium]